MKTLIYSALSFTSAITFVGFVQSNVLFYANKPDPMIAGRVGDFGVAFMICISLWLLTAQHYSFVKKVSE